MVINAQVNGALDWCGHKMTKRFDSRSKEQEEEPLATVALTTAIKTRQELAIGMVVAPT